MKHIKGIDKTRKFVYCELHHIISWLVGDYDNGYCAACHIYFEDN